MSSNPTQAFYDRLSRAYDLLADASERRARTLGIDLLGPRAGDRILELGCGTGSALAPLADAVGEAGAVVGLDLSAGMLAMSRRRFGDEARPLPVLVHGDATRLPFPGAAFDAVFAAFTVELFEAPARRQVLAEIRRVLRPAARLAVVSLHLTAHPGPIAELYRWLHRHFPHVVDCQPIAVPEILEAAGFRVVGQEPLSIAGLPVLAVCAVQDRAPHSSSHRAERSVATRVPT